jgi:ATP-dependent RNA helicase RhlE
VEKLHVVQFRLVFWWCVINTQKTTVYQGCDILVGTPGRIMDLTLDNVIRFEEIKLVIDEFDEMLNLGF